MRRLALIVAFIACACGSEERPGPHELPAGERVTPAAPEQPAPLAMALEVATTEADLDAGRLGGSFPIDEVEDLLARVRFGGDVPAGERLQLEVYAPGGGLWTVYERSVDADAVLFVVAVGGTDLERWSLTGSFGLVATVAGRPELTASAAIELTEEQP